MGGSKGPVGNSPGSLVDNQISVWPTLANDWRAESTALVPAPLMARVATTAMVAVIMVTQTRCGAGAIAAAATVPAAPKQRATTPHKATSAGPNANPSASTAPNMIEIEASEIRPRLVMAIANATAAITTAVPAAAYRIQWGTVSAAETPTGASASIGETL